MNQSSGNNAWDDLAKMLQADMAKEVHVRVKCSDGSQLVERVYCEGTFIDEVSGRMLTIMELGQLVDCMGDRFSPREASGVCTGCNELVGPSFAHCQRCSVFLCRKCTSTDQRKDGSEDFYCRKCFRRIKSRRILKNIGRVIASVVIEWEDD